MPDKTEEGGPYWNDLDGFGCSRERWRDSGDEKAELVSVKVVVGDGEQISVCYRLTDFSKAHEREQTLRAYRDMVSGLIKLTDLVATKMREYEAKDG